METIKRIKYKEWNCLLQRGHYENGRVALCIIADENDPECPYEPVSKCTVNLPNEPLAKDEVFIKDYSENEGMVNFLEREGIVKRTGREVQSGYVSIVVCKLLL